MRTFRKRVPPAGSRPGTLAIAPEAPAPTINVVRYDPSGYEFNSVQTVAELDALIDDTSVVWIDVVGLNGQTLLDFGERFDLHPLLLEDVAHVPQRPKVDYHDNVLLVVSRMLQYSMTSGLEAEQVSVFLTGNIILSFQEREGDVLGPIRDRIRAGKGAIRKSGADYLLYAILDAIIDAYYPALEAIGDKLEALEDQVMLSPVPEVLRDITMVKSDLLTMRRGVWPQREALSRLGRGEIEGISRDVQVYFRDVHDHAVQTADVIESYRELTSGLLNTYLTVVANKTNDIMKVLTVMASIFIPLTFLAGIYGMNFEYMPELKFHWAYPTLLGVMIVATGAMVLWFRRRGWLS